MYVPHVHSLTGIKVDAVDPESNTHHQMVEEGIVLSQRSHDGIKEGHVLVLSKKGFAAVQLKARDFLAKLNGVDYKIIKPPPEDDTKPLALNVVFSGDNITKVLYNSMQMRTLKHKYTEDYEMYYGYSDYPRTASSKSICSTMGVTSPVSGDGWVVGIFAGWDKTQRRVFVGIRPLASSEFAVTLAEFGHVKHRTAPKGDILRAPEPAFSKERIEKLPYVSLSKPSAAHSGNTRANKKADPPPPLPPPSSRSPPPAGVQGLRQSARNKRTATQPDDSDDSSVLSYSDGGGSADDKDADEAEVEAVDEVEVVDGGEGGGGADLIACSGCGKECKGERGLKMHQKKCKKGGSSGSADAAKATEAAMQATEKAVKAAEKAANAKEKAAALALEKVKADAARQIKAAEARAQKAEKAAEARAQKAEKAAAEAAKTTAANAVAKPAAADAQAAERAAGAGAAGAGAAAGASVATRKPTQLLELAKRLAMELGLNASASVPEVAKAAADAGYARSNDRATIIAAADAMLSPPRAPATHNNRSSDAGGVARGEGGEGSGERGDDGGNSNAAAAGSDVGGDVGGNLAAKRQKRAVAVTWGAELPEPFAPQSMASPPSGLSFQQRMAMSELAGAHAEANAAKVTAARARGYLGLPF